MPIPAPETEVINVWKIACDGGEAGQTVNVRLTALTKEGMTGHVVELIE